MEQVFPWGPLVTTLIFLPLAIWDSVWKAIALWKAGGNRDSAWFICIFIFNTVGILPIIYIFGFSKKKSV
jgi:hypothetical protein